MMTAEDYRRKAAEHLQASQEASDQRTSQSLRRLSDAWATLAGQIEKDPHTVRQRNAALKQPHQTEPRKANTNTAEVADILRERLQLSDSDEPRS
jgi:formiminotetrahydrofolate cyclodeaminase